MSKFTVNSKAKVQLKRNSATDKHIFNISNKVTSIVLIDAFIISRYFMHLT